MANPSPVPPSKFDCSGSKIFAFCFGSSPTPVSRNAIRSQNGLSSSFTVKVPPSGIARRALSHRFQKTCLILFGSTLAMSCLPLKFRAMRYLLPTSGFFSSSVSVLKNVSFFARIVQEIRDDMIQPFGFPPDDIHELTLILFERHHSPQFLHGSGHRRQRLPD